MHDCCTYTYMLFMIGVILFSHKKRAYVHVRYIESMANIKEISNYVWGAAMMACIEVWSLSRRRLISILLLVCGY